MAARCALILLLTFTCGLLADAAPYVKENGFRSGNLRGRCPFNSQFETVEYNPGHGRQHSHSADECCPDGWSRFESRCFMFFHGPKSWIDAELSCIGVGGNLASVHSWDENQFLRDIVLRVTGHHLYTWIGAHDGVREGVWQWSDGSEFDFTHWAHGEPNNLHGEHCLTINWGKHLWNDLNCDHYLPFVCSAPSVPKTE